MERDPHPVSLCDPCCGAGQGPAPCTLQCHRLGTLRCHRALPLARGHCQRQPGWEGGGRVVRGGSPTAPCPCPPSSAPCLWHCLLPEHGAGRADSPFPGPCSNVTAQSHLELKVWICHTLRNELLGAASVSLGSLLKGGGKREYGAGQGTGQGLGQSPGQRWPWWPCSPAGNKVPLCVPGRACCGRTCVSAGTSAGWEHKPLCFPPPFAVARAWLVTAAPT